jgi:hypothetical protein
MEQVKAVIAIFQNKSPSILDEKYRILYKDPEMADSQAFKAYEEDREAHKVKEEALIAYLKLLEMQILSFDAKAIMNEVMRQD